MEEGTNFSKLPLRVELDPMDRREEIPDGYQEDILGSKDSLAVDAIAKGGGGFSSLEISKDLFITGDL